MTNQAKSGKMKTENTQKQRGVHHQCVFVTDPSWLGIGPVLSYSSVAPLDRGTKNHSANMNRSVASSQAHSRQTMIHMSSLINRVSEVPVSHPVYHSDT